MQPISGNEHKMKSIKESHHMNGFYKGITIETNGRCPLPELHPL